MRIVVTQIEASAEELRASRTVADTLYSILNNALCPCHEEESEEEESDGCE